MSWWIQAEGDTSLRCQVVVVGSGPAGAIAGLTLAEAGLDVVLLEEGHHRAPRSMPVRQSRAFPMLFQEGGMRTTRGRPPVPLPTGRGLGGGSLVNSAISFRTPEAIVNEWNQRSGGSFPSLPEFYDAQDDVEAVVRVGRTPDRLLSGNDVAHREAARNLDWSEENFRRNAPTCVGCGRCNTGCPSGGKFSVDREVLPRLATAGGRIYAGAKVDRVAPGRVEGSLKQVDGTLVGRLTVDAEIVVLAAGALGTPKLLLDSEVARPSGEVGRGLQIHPVAGSFGFVPSADVRAWGASQGHYIDQFIEDQMLLESSLLAPANIFASLPVHGTQAMEIMASVSQVVTTGALIRDTTEGRVLPSRGPGARVRYVVNDVDRQRLIRGLRRCARLWLEGAEADFVWLGVHGSQLLTDMRQVEEATPPDLAAESLLLYASHPQASCRLGRATDEHGELLEAPGIFCVDSSVLPTAVGRNPQISIMTVARLLAMRLATRLGGRVQDLWPTARGPRPDRVPQPGARTALGGNPDKMRTEEASR